MKLFATYTELWNSVKRDIIQKNISIDKLKEKRTGYLITLRRWCWGRCLGHKACSQIWLEGQARLDLMDLVQRCRWAIWQARSGNLLWGVQLHWGIWCMRQLRWAQVPKTFLMCLHLGQVVCDERWLQWLTGVLNLQGLNVLVEGSLEEEAEEKMVPLEWVSLC